MKCPKCGYHSFEHLEDCRKCGVDLGEHKQKFNLRGFYSPGQTEQSVAAVADEPGAVEAALEEENVDFGFDFLDEDEAESAEEAASETSADVDDGLAEAFEETEESPKAAAQSEISFDDDEVSIEQPFGIDSETVPADESAGEDDTKKGPGSEFSF